MISPRAPQDGDRSRKAVLPVSCGAIGAQLTAVREARQLSVETVASRLLLSRGQVLGLEHADPSAFYNHTFFLKGLRKYMALLELPPELLVEEDEQEDADALRLLLAETSGPLPGDTRSTSRANLWTSGAAAALVAFVGVGLYAASSSWRPAHPADDDTVSLSVESPIPAQPLHVGGAAPAAVVATPAGTSGVEDADSTVRISVGKPTWVYVRYPGNRVVERKLAAGEELAVGPLPVYLAVGTADSVELRVENRPIALGPYIRDGQVRLTQPDLAKLVP